MTAIAGWVVAGGRPEAMARPTSRRIRSVGTRPQEASPAELVARALDGDRRAWEEVVARYKGVAWKVISTFDLGVEDRNDVFAATFFRLFERLTSIREPEKLPGWIATTTRNEALSLLRSRRRERPAAWVGEEHHTMAVPDPDPTDERLLEDELRAAVRDAFADLAPECRELLALASADPPLSYDDIAEITGRPRGSLGPTRQRCLDRLRRHPRLRPFLDEREP